MLRYSRPLPPDDIFAAPPPVFRPAPDLAAWIADVFISSAGPLANAQHDVLQYALIGCLWTNARFEKAGGFRVAGQAERPNFDGPAWTRARQEFQMLEWFGAIPDFILTFDAVVGLEADDRRWCALVDHELRHCVQAKSKKDGQPRFTRDGRPVFALVGHDVEEFVDVLSRYGAGSCAGKTVDFTAAAATPPLVAEALITAACGRDP